MPVDDEAQRLTGFIEKGLEDGLVKKYLDKVLFCISKTVGGPVIAKYTCK